MFAIWTEVARVEPVSVGRLHLHRLFEEMAVARSSSSSSGMSSELPRRLEPAEFHLMLSSDNVRPPAYSRIGLWGLCLQQFAWLFQRCDCASQMWDMAAGNSIPKRRVPR
ncbi:hypothetical protein CEJ86_32570 [Sinorhizobium meliloti]|uniref:Uncharacterized protein n=1 Tax=Rhizobium meliloti TaxID=382 RepID=A0A2J0YT09_RHIML|nr:hypothetical protein CEJ86_32570 [Sinorhizobium meliloti]